MVSIAQHPHTIVVVEPSPFVADVLCTHLRQQGCVPLLRAADESETLAGTGNARLIALSVEVMARDEQGRERPYWHLLASRPPLPIPVICYSGNNKAHSDTPLFTPPPGTMLVGSPQDFLTLANIIIRHSNLFAKHGGLGEALAGRCLAALTGSFADFGFDAVLKLLQLNDHTGVLVIRHGLHVGIIAVEKGDVVHALVGSLSGQDAFCELFRWETARYAFLRGMILGERTIRKTLDTLLLEAIRTGDEADYLMSTVLSLQSYVQRVHGYTDQLQNKRLSQTEWKVLWMVDRFHIVNDLIRSVDGSSVMALKALRRLMQEGLVESLPLQQPTSAFD